MKRTLLILSILTLLFNNGFSQPVNRVKWSFEQKKISETVYELHFNATIDNGWHLYSNTLPEGGPIPTSINYESTEGFKLSGDLETNKKPVVYFDEIFSMELEYFGDQVTFTQKIEILGNNPLEISGYIEYMSCNDESCTPPAETEFSFLVGPAPSVSSENIVPSEKEAKTVEKVAEKNEKPSVLIQTVEEKTEPVQEVDEISEPEPADGAGGKKQQGWLVFLLIAFAAGLAAVVTPCVFPMIPMTVSFFMRGSQSKGGAIKTALFFGGSIVFIYALLGALFTFNIFGANVGNVLSTHWIPNALFFLLFVVFALSFFGLFEIVLPGSLVNKTDAKADKGGLIGAFFMALTTVIVSFSCTGPFIGSLIIEAVQKGGLVPLFGMVAFGVAFALPFTLLAFFPSAMKKLPKSGGWLNEVKVVFAFVLLAFSLKFLNVVFHDFVTRDVFLAIWITLSVLMGIYLLGKLRFSHDSEVNRIGVGRLLLAVVSFTFALYLFTGLLGAPLKTVSSLVPAPSVTAVPVLSEKVVQNTPACGPAKYADKLHLPHGLTGYFDYEQGLACAKEQNKPAFVVFKGHACANCKKMENSVWADPEVLEKLKNDFVIVALYTDDRTKLPETDWKTSSLNGKTLKTLGRVNLDLLISKYDINSIPYHVIIEPDGAEHELEVTYDTEVFNAFLNKWL
ncbi:MAG: thioredoxin family protein [Prolixibacteraceae bacterium]|nr:thioredoxin family protein [Prolixibacteraceae bacterium]